MGKYSIAVVGQVWDGRGKVPHGGALVTFELTRRLSKYFDCEMVFETSDKNRIGEVMVTDAGFTKRFIPRPNGLWRLDRNFIQSYDLIHIWGPAPIFAYRAYVKDVFVPHCYTLHSAASMINWIGIASAFYVPEYDMISLGSQSLADALNKFWKVHVNVIPYGVNVDVFKPMDKSECREYFGIPKDSFVFGYIGRPAKIDFLLAYETLKKVKEISGRNDVILLVAGGKRRIKPVRVTDSFLYLGYLDKMEVPIMLNSCDVFYNPVASVQEGFGLTVVEAMACGLPVVTTAWNGYRETVSKDVGFLARTCWKDGDVWINWDDLISACLRLLEDDELREECSKRARERVEKKYRWENCVEKYRNRFFDLIRKGHPDRLPYEDAPKKIRIYINGKIHICSLEEAFKKIYEYKISFQKLYSNFVSEGRMSSGLWRRFICKDNILNLPKYGSCMKDTLLKEEEKLQRYFPRLVNALKG